jgi:ribonuclease MRP protein subunit RMP1
MAAPAVELLQSDKISSELANLSKILHLLHHRSKNQHRRSIWYRHFNTMRRHLQHLQDEVSPDLPPAWPPSRKRKRKEECEVRADQRMQLWADVLVPKWFAAFSQIVADKRFAALGLVLLAALGRMCKITGVLERIEEGADEDVRLALAKFADGEGGRALRGFDAHVNEMEEVGEESDDVGTVVARVEDEESAEFMVDAGDGAPKTGLHERASPVLEVEGVAPKRKRKTRSKKGDAIDDIFAGLF